MLLLANLFALSASAAVAARFATNQLELVVLPGFNHLPQTLTVTSNNAVYRGELTVTSDSSWARPIWNGAEGRVELTFDTANFVASQTATIRIQTAEGTHDAFVHGTVVPLNILKFIDDPARSRVYGVHASGLQQGAVAVIDPIAGQLLTSITVGRKPTDLTIFPASDELLVLNHADKNVSVIDLATLKIKQTFSLPQYGDWGTESTAGNIAAGAANILYYSDGNWAPTLYVYNRATAQNIQVITDSGAGYGFGDFALTPDRRNLIAWAQYGWSAGYAGSHIARFSVGANGLLTVPGQVGTEQYPNFMRDPLDTPVLIDQSGGAAFVKTKAVDPTNISRTIQTFPSSLYAISPGGEIATTSEGIYETSTGNRLASLSGAPAAQVVTSDYARLVYFSTATRQIQFLNLLQTVGPEVLGRIISPANNSIVNAPSTLTWSSVPGVGQYHVYFGASRSAVESATLASPEFLATVGMAQAPLNQSLLPGQTYYWRVDAVSDRSVVTGEIFAFTVSEISVSPSRVEGATIQGAPRAVVATIDLSSNTPGRAWIAQGAHPWITCEAASGTTPAGVKIFVDATQLPVGVTNTTILVGPDANSLVAVPLRLRVEPLLLTILKSDPTSAMVYGISENTQIPDSPAYLVEMNSETEQITRVRAVGTSVTDLAIHNPEGRLYVPNWRTGTLLALNKTTLELERSYSFRPFGGVGYGDGDVFRISAGVRGRLVVEEMDQWIDISIFDTTSGETLRTAFVREGGGGFDPTGRYYYHGENNSSGATIQRYDVTGDTFTRLANVRVESASYYGSRVVTVSEDGSRVFWNGSAFDAALSEQWAFAQMVYSCTPDGRFAFARENVYDINLRRVAFAMPVATTVSAFNSTTSKLIAQRDNRVEFFRFTPGAIPPVPILSVATVTHQAATLSWRNVSLGSTFTIQARVAGTPNWADVATPGSSASSHVVSNLLPETTYEFRIKADATWAQSSDWSDVVTVTTPGIPPTAPTLYPPVVSSSAVRLIWSDPTAETAILLERAADGEWSLLRELPAGSTSFTDTEVTPQRTYLYRVIATNRWASATSQTITVNVPVPTPPATPNITNIALTPSLGVVIYWNHVADTTSYEIQRRTESGQWSALQTFPSGLNYYSDATVDARREYFYRLVAINAVGRSEPSNEVSIFTQRIACLFSDEFEGGLDPAAWQSVQGGQPRNGELGYNQGAALVFSGAETRAATTAAVRIEHPALLRFAFRFGNGESPEWDRPDSGEHVILEASTSADVWQTLEIYSATAVLSWLSVAISLPESLAGQTVRFRWRQFRHSGEGNDVWALDNVCLQAPEPAPPAAPPFIMANSNNSRSVALLWVAGENALSYIVERAAPNSQWTTIATTGAAQTWFTDTSCLPSTTYAYRVRAANAAGPSAPSLVAFATTISQMVEWQVAELGSSQESMLAIGDDGIPILARYAFGLGADEELRPCAPAELQPGVPAISRNDATGQLEITFLRRKAERHPGILYFIQFSDDLQTWTDGGRPLATQSVDELWELVQFTEDAPPGQTRFARVAVTLAP